MNRWRLFWGDTHTNLHSHHLEQLDLILRYAREVLDFWAIAYYPQEYRTERGFRYEDWLDAERIEREWQIICDLAKRNNVPGEFVTFPGYEWQGDGRWGDHNVFYFDDYQPLIRVDTLPELYAELKRRRLKAFAIPHHTAYLVGIRGKNWDVHDEELSPFVEIYSQHGCSESDEEWIGLRENWHMGPNVSGGTVEEGLMRGYRLGIICSTDNHTGFAGCYGHGLMACYATQLTRTALWEAFSERRVYGVTGDRIELHFEVEGAPMGAVINKRGAVHISISVRGCDAIDRIELLRNNVLIAGYFHNGRWSVPDGDERIRAKMRVEVGWGPMRMDIPDLPPREWSGSIAIPNGCITSIEKCWRTHGQWVRLHNDSQCEFGFCTTQSTPGGGIPTEALIFELEGRPNDSVQLIIENRKLEFTLAEAMHRSQLIYFPEEVKAHIRTTHGIDTDALPRDDPFLFLSHKVKVHRAIPAVGYIASFNYVDESPPAGTNFYRVRVHQRNGQVAWSSPVWVRNE